MAHPAAVLPITANLCKCNKCGSILIDQNPQINAKEHTLQGKEIDMQYKDDNDGSGGFWVCPICDSDAFLIDL